MTSDRQATPDGRPDVARIRNVYDVVLCAVLALMFVVGPIYLFFVVYFPKFFAGTS